MSLGRGDRFEQERGAKGINQKCHEGMLVY